MMNMKTDFVLSLIDAKKTKNNYYLFFEYFNGGDLRRLFEAQGCSLPEKAVRIITT